MNMQQQNSNPMATLNSTSVKLWSQAEKSQKNPPSKVNIEKAMAICFQIVCFPKTCEKIENRQFFRKLALDHPIFSLDGGFLWLFSAFDLRFTVIPLKVVIGLGKIDFLVL